MAIRWCCLVPGRTGTSEERMSEVGLAVHPDKTLYRSNIRLSG
jgi:hypothetical protein